jgi:hypothetical protein
MRNIRTRFATLACAPLLLGSMLAMTGLADAAAPAGGPPPPGEGRPKPPMSFFVTSVGLGKGGDLGGLAGADAHCQSLAKSVGRGDVTWHAYLSTQGPNAVNARDRIGKGPWFSATGQQVAKDVAELHGDTLELARMGNNIHGRSAVNEKGEPIPPMPLIHDMLTGTKPDGTAYTDTANDLTCKNWTSSSGGAAQLGHHDRQGLFNTSWNSSHASTGCSPDELVKTGGAGLFYCFVAN